jgi:hypothetical protein
MVEEVVDPIPMRDRHSLYPKHRKPNPEVAVGAVPGHKTITPFNVKALFLLQLATATTTGTSPFLHRRRSLHIGHLGWQHQCAAVIALVKVSQYLCCLGRLIFLDEMACFRENLELIFAWEE